MKSKLSAFALVLLALFLGAGETPVALAQSKKAKPAGELDPTYRPDDKLVNVAYRYYVWYGSDNLWHLRGASKDGLARFNGTVTVHGGTFARCRPIGLETKSKANSRDQWALNAERTRLEFKMVTGESFDGFDYSVTGKDATIEFDLYVGDRHMPRRVFIGQKAHHPAEIPFTLPATPSRIPPPESEKSVERGSR